MKIVVLVKQVPDTWGERRMDASSGRLDRAGSDAVIDEIDERALEIALRYQEAHGAEVVALTLGPASASVTLRKALALGADSALHVQDDRLAGADIAQTARALALARLTGPVALPIAAAGTVRTRPRPVRMRPSTKVPGCSGPGSGRSA